VGERPAWLRNVLHIPHPDRHTCKERNILDKILAACAWPELSEKFLFMNDDHLALADMNAEEMPNWRGGSLEELGQRLPHSHHYGQAVRNTGHFLTVIAASTWNFDVHTPIVYDKELFPKVLGLVNWDAYLRGFVIKSLYANFLELPHEYLRDLKLTRRHSFTELVGQLRGRPWWSIGPSAINSNLQRLLAELYPNPSEFEI
jgi:hypothetical protein